MRILTVFILSLVFTSFTHAAAYVKFDGVKEGNLHKSDMNKNVAKGKKAESATITLNEDEQGNWLKNKENRKKANAVYREDSAGR